MSLFWNFLKTIFGFVLSLGFNFISGIGGMILAIPKEAVVTIALILLIGWLIYLIRNDEIDDFAKYGSMAGSVSGFLGLIANYQVS